MEGCSRKRRNEFSERKIPSSFMKPRRHGYRFQINCKFREPYNWPNGQIPTALSISLLAILLSLTLHTQSLAVDSVVVAEGYYPDIAVDAKAVGHIVYGRGEQLYYRTFSTKSWAAGEEQTVPIAKSDHPFDLNRADPDIVIDSKGNPHVYAWGAYAFMQHGRWETVSLHPDPSTPYRDSELAIDSQDTVYLCSRGGFQGGNVGVQKRTVDADHFVAVSDPDLGLTHPEITNHVYGDLAISPVDDSLHFIQRHGPGKVTAYRRSRDGGIKWDLRNRVCDAEPEAPHIAVDDTGLVVATNGYGEFFRFDQKQWISEGFPIRCRARDQPELAVDRKNNIYIACFGGQFNVRQDGRWGETQHIAPDGDKAIGFVEISGLSRGVLAVWEEGSGVQHEQMAKASSNIVVGSILPNSAGKSSHTVPQKQAESIPSQQENSAPEKIKRFGCFETVVRNDRSYVDPYRDVMLKARFSNSYGQTFEVDGFYNGGDKWVIRFRADVPGKWEYIARFSDGAPGTKGMFHVRGRMADHEPVQINPVNPIWFRRGVEPFYPRAFHVGDRFFAENWSGDLRTKFLDWFQQQGYNTLSVASHYLNRDVDGRGKGWDTPKLWPLQASEYRKMERILDELERRGIVVFPFAGFIGKESNYPREWGDQEIYVRYTMARIGHYGNLLYNVAGPEPNLDDDWFPAERVERIGRLIRDNDVYGHPLSVHNRTGDDPYRDSDWTTFGTLQGPKTLERAKLSSGLLESHHASKPLFAQETLWAGNQFHIKRNGRNYSDQDLRKHAFVIALSGASFCFADNQGNSSSGFTGTIALEDCSMEKHKVLQQVWDVIESVPYFEMKPSPESVDRGYCLAEQGRRYLIYQETKGRFQVLTDAGPFHATWINAQNATDRRDGGLVVTNRGKTQILETPSDGDDWLLLLTSVGTGLPEQVHLSWSDDPMTSFTATWHTPSGDNPAEIHYRPTDESPWKIANGNSKPSPGEGFIHRATVRGLSPQTEYDYRLTSDRGIPIKWSTPRKVQTAPRNEGDFSFVFVADTGLDGRLDGNATGTKRIIDQIVDAKPLFVLGGGDYAYANRDKRFETVGAAIDEWFFQYEPALSRFPLMAQYGNHEIYLTERFEDWAPRFAHPDGFEDSRSYSFDVGDTHFTAFLLVDKEPTVEQIAWLDKDLRQARQRGQKWLIVYHHEPLYAFGRSHPSKIRIASKLIPVLERHQVDLDLSTHDQSYERTFPLLGSSKAPHVQSTSLTEYPAKRGVVYAKISPGGKKSEIGNTFSKFTINQQSFIATRDDSSHHYAEVSVHGGESIKVVIWGVPDDPAEKFVVDEFSITK